MRAFENTSYIFIPITMEKHTDYTVISEGLENSGNWEQIHDEITYMLKYVADKINSKNRKTCQCFHYRFNDAQRKLKNMASRYTWYATDLHPFNDRKKAFRFQILHVDLFSFSTGICILAFRIHFQNSDPLWISSAQYYLKKVSREKLKPEDAAFPQTTMLDLAKSLLSEFEPRISFTFFYYANPGTERANILTYLEVPPKEDYRQELFYLRRCYSEDYAYFEDEKLDGTEIYASAKDIVWGISPEAAVCLTSPNSDEQKRANFIRKRFYNNFQEQYLFMYVLLLHQKYVLYYFQMQIGIGTYNSIEMLEEYQKQLFEFEADFVFSCVTEVPQYQMLYSQMTKAFSLKQMYKDVHEPLMALSELRRAASEKEKEQQEDTMNQALAGLSLLTIASALIDSFGFVESLSTWRSRGIGVLIAQGVCIILISVVAVPLFKTLFASKTQSKRKKKGGKT